MAKLISEDEQVRTSFELILIKNQVKNKPGVSWISYKLIIESGYKKLTYENEDNNKGAGDYVFALEPVNEIENLINSIKSFLENQNKNLFSFEPLEPSFELILERSHKGYSVISWVDAGNVISDHYSWDGFGVRFFTTKEKINLFIDELKNESKGLLQQAPTEDGMINNA